MLRAGFKKLYEKKKAKNCMAGLYFSEKYRKPMTELEKIYVFYIKKFPFCQVIL